MTDPRALQGSKERALARAIQLVNLLLQGPQDRQALGGRLAEALEAIGWQAASSSDADGLRNQSRDLATLRRLGLLEIGRSKVYRAVPGPNLPIWATPAEAQALAIAAASMQQLGLPEAALLEAMSHRIPPGIRQAGERRAVSLTPSLRVGNERIWDAVQQAVVEGRCLRLLYQKPGGRPAEEIVVDRAEVVWLTGAFYLVAFRPDYEHKQPGRSPWEYVREYRLDRIHAAEVLNAPVKRVALPPVRCKIILDAELRERVFTLHSQGGRVLQHAEPRDDGTVRLTFEDVSILRARQRALSFGEHLLAVESPDELREQITRAIGSLASRFAAHEATR